MAEAPNVSAERMELYTLARSLAEALREQIEAARSAGAVDDARYADLMARHERLERSIRRMMDRLSMEAT